MPLNRIAAEVAQLSARHVSGELVTDDDGTELFLIGDGESGVEITHEIGDLFVAGQRLLRLADDLHHYAHDLLARASARDQAYLHGPHTGPGASR